MGYEAELRAIQAAERRQQREAQKRLRDLERQAKEQAKLSAIEQARLEVETHENRLDLLLSVHKEQGPTWDYRETQAIERKIKDNPSLRDAWAKRQLQMELIERGLPAIEAALGTSPQKEADAHLAGRM